LGGRVTVADDGNPVPGVAVEVFDVTKAKKPRGRLSAANFSAVVEEQLGFSHH
jgi:hypothetical protein